jgi:sulfoxide reductase heme-binding subunit YedZ
MTLAGRLAPLALWRDRGGRFSVLRALVLVGVLLPAAVLAAQYVSGALGPRRAHAAILLLGLWTIRLLMISLAVTPAARIFAWQRLPLVRRMLGVACACYAVAHLCLYVVDQNFRLLFVVQEIALRIYLTIGFAALAGLVVLAVTSTDRWMRRLGRRWKRLHRLIYPIGALAVVHYFLQTKADVTDAVFLAGCFIWLMLWRLLPMAAQRAIWPLPLLAVAAGALTALVEFAWYGLATGINPWLVLQANLDVSDDYSPALRVAMLALAVAAAAALWRVAGWSRARLRRPA